MDWFMLVLTAMLALFGTIMVYSASAMISLKETGGQTQFAYFYKQLGFTLVGLGVMAVAARVDYHRLNNKWIVFALLGLTAALLIAVFAFPAINGARRWIRVAGFSLQPSEIAKITLPLFRPRA